MKNSVSAAIAQRHIASEVERFPRVLIAHDWLVDWAGSERCVEQMLHVFPNADLLVGVLDPRMRGLNAVTQRARETWLARVPFARTRHRWFLPLEAAAFASVDTSDYDLVISSAHAFSKAVRTSGNTLHVSYCYSPPRYLWDLSETYRERATWVQRLALSAGSDIMKRVDIRTASSVDHFIGISRYVAERINRCYGRDAEVVYPPVTPRTDATQVYERGDFILHLGRLVPYKRVDLVIAAAERLRIPLVVAGDGPDRARLEHLAGRFTTFRGRVSEDEASRLLSTCRAFVFCAEEDFGIAPVEANAHGTPVVGYGKGALLETMIDGRTGVLFPEQSVDAVAAAIERALGMTWRAEHLRINAARFGAQRFRVEFLAAIQRQLAARVRPRNVAA